MNKKGSALIVDIIFRFCKEQYNELKDVDLTIDNSFYWDDISNVLVTYDGNTYKSPCIKYGYLAYDEEGFKENKEKFLITDLFKNLKIESNLDAFILSVLHEIGHIIRRNNGTYNNERKQHELYKIKHSNIKSNLKRYKRYRAIKEEREADRFASKNYNTVKYILQPTIKLIELSNEQENEINRLKNELFHEKSKDLNVKDFEIKILKTGE